MSRAGGSARRGGRAAWPRWVALLASLGACGGDSQPDPPDTGDAAGSIECPSGLPSNAACAGDAPSYELTVAPIIERRCGGCHFPGNTQSGDVFAEYGDIYPVRQTVLTRLYTCAMPPEGAPSLTPDERRALLQWFVCGAPEN
jgi:hypothetical protein